jgi:N-acetylmuramoyl-L-alanine amidase
MWVAASREEPRPMNFPLTGLNLLMTGRPGRRPATVPAPVALLVLAIAAALVAATPRDTLAVDTYVDPLAYTRIDPQAPVVNLVVEQRATRQSSMVTGRRLLKDVREVYVRSADLSTMLKAGRLWQDTLRRLELTVGGQSFVVTGGSRVLLSGGNETLLPVPVLDHDGDLWLPLTALVRVIGPQAKLDVTFDAGTGRLALGRADDNIEGLGLTLGENGTTARVNCREALSWSVERVRGDLLELTINGGRGDARRLAGTSGLGLVRAVECRQEAGRTIIGLRLAADAGEQRSRADDDGKVIIIELTTAAPIDSTLAVVGGEDQGSVTSPDVTGPTAPDLKTPLRRVIVDAGHGGADTGAIGVSGVMEKDVNLAVARELKQYLERESNLDVTLTRSRDESMELDARAEAANTAGGELFISLHCNSWFDDNANGFETFFLSPASSDWARSVAATENGTTAGGEPGDVEFIVWELVQNRFINRSAAFAEFLQERACRSLSLPDRGVRQAGFRVLVGAYMPAVLVELGFLSNAGEESRLDDRNYQRQLARAIGDAVLAYARGAGATDGEP